MKEDEVGEKLVSRLKAIGFDFRRYRPEDERCWGFLSLDGKNGLEINGDKVTIKIGEYPNYITAQIKIFPSTIKRLSEDCISIGSNTAFINFNKGLKEGDVWTSKN